MAGFRLFGFCIFGLAASASALIGATVQTVDDVTIKNASITFDGQVLTVTSTTQPTPTTMPLEDAARISLRELVVEASATPTTPTSITRVRRVRKHPATHSSINPSGNPPVAAAAGVTPIPGSWRMKLADGDALHGAIESWADQKLIVRPDAAPDAQVGIDAAQLEWVWHGDASDQAKAEAMSVGRGDQDTAYVRKETDIIALQGAAVGVDGDEMLFRYEGEDRKINLAKMIGIVFAARSPQNSAQNTSATADQSFHQVLRLVDGERISGQWTSLADKVLTLKTGGDRTARFAISEVAGIDFVNGRITYLSDLTPSKVEQTPFFDEIIPYKTDAALDGGPLRLGDAVYDKGLAVHSQCILEYDLGGRFDRFRTKMGFEPGAGALGDAIVRVLGDGGALYENKSAKGTDSPVSIDVDATGITHLVLEVDFGEGQDVGDRVVWADARAVKAKFLPTNGQQ